MYFSLRTAGEPTALVSAVRQAVREVDSNLPVTDYQVTNDAGAGEWAGTFVCTAPELFRRIGASGSRHCLSGVLAYSVAQRD